MKLSIKQLRTLIREEVQRCENVQPQLRGSDGMHTGSALSHEQFEAKHPEAYADLARKFTGRRARYWKGVNEGDMELFEHPDGTLSCSYRNAGGDYVELYYFDGAWNRTEF